MIIAVDGPTASGKGTIAKALAARFGLPHLDTGLLYRAVGRQVALSGGDPDREADALAACGFADALLADPELRSEASGGLASRVSIHPAVREALYQRQRAFARGQRGIDLRRLFRTQRPGQHALHFRTVPVPDFITQTVH